MGHISTDRIESLLPSSEKQELVERLKAIFVDYGQEPHWCGKVECEASRQSELFFEAIASAWLEDRELVKQRETDLTITNLINKGLFTLDELNAALNPKKEKNDGR